MDARKISWVAWSKLTKPKAAGGLGFRDIVAFNDSLLAKLTWRLLKSPRSLVAQVLLRKYCHYSSMLQAQVPSNASHGWRGIIAGIEVLNQGLGWLVGSGNNINIWNDAWLATSMPLIPVGPPTRANQFMTVASLINQNTRTGNWDRIRQHIPQYEDHIRKISLGTDARNDSLVWLPERKGVYTTKSGYSHLTSPTLEVQSTHFNWLKSVWKVKTVPKIQTFLWKANSGALPVGQQLISRGMQVEGLCKRCGEMEDIDHFLLTCNYAQRVWENAPIFIPPFPNVPTIQSFLSAATSFKNLPPVGLSKASLSSWILWTLWKNRNLLVFQNRSFTERDTLVKAIQEAKAWEEAQLSIKQTTSNVEEDVNQDRQSASDLNNTTPLCFVDAAWKENSGCGGLGWIFLSDSQELICEASISISNLPSVLVAEATAIQQALEQAKAMRLDCLRLFSDCQVLVNLLRNGEDYNELFGILCDIRMLTTEFRSISFHYVPRTQNITADLLAKKALASLEQSVK